MKVAMHRYTSPDDAFIVCAPTYKILQQSTLPAFLKLMSGLGTYSRADSVFTTHWGSKCYMRTATEPDSIVGITNVRHIWVDEAGKVSLYFWENVQARSAFRDCPIDLTSSPYTLNWLFKEIVRPKQKDAKALPHVDLIQAASWDNPFMPKTTIDHARATMDPRRFNALFGGAWERMAGLVYDCFDEIENVVKPHTLPPGTEYFAGVDWGYTNPFAVTVRAVTPDGMHYQVGELYRAQMSPSQKVEAARRLKLAFNIKMFYCDPEEPASIAEFCANGIPAVAADNDVKRGIELHYELIKTRRFKIFEGTSPHSMDEIESYHWPEPKDLKPDQDEKDPNPVAQNNHALDSARYASISLVHSVTKQHEPKRRPRAAEDRPRQIDHHVETERLKRGPRVGGTEEWSA
jgi:phage terminase large subunit